MKSLVLSFVQQGSTGQMKSECLISSSLWELSHCTHTETSLSRIKLKLRKGEYTVSGDQWPIMLYASYKYDEQNPWKGLLQSTILVEVSCIIILPINYI